MLGKHDAWDADAARKAATLFARKKDSLGTAIAPNAEALSAWIIDTLIRTSAETLLETSLANDRFAATHMAGVLLAASVRDDPGRLIDFQLRLSVPLIGLGAAAPSYYPEVADRLRTTALIPEHADVANAIGAVVGHVRVTAEALIAQIEEGVFRLYMADAPNDFTSLDAAVSFSEQALAIEAGAGADHDRREGPDPKAARRPISRSSPTASRASIPMARRSAAGGPWSSGRHAHHRARRRQRRTDAAGRLADDPEGGPRRLVPLSQSAAQHADLVHGTLDRQLKKPRVDETDGRFAMAVGRESAHLAALQPGETELLELLLADPLPLGSTSPRRRRALVHGRAAGLAMITWSPA